ncbi:pro-epidermal growth factor-like isoform X1 [Lethenteron reissneri]|uniref:pro-epidermal growth factor-like isoform X1 n=1 Tax=Lethenteron reissneri TaxID=7753 RepID=UPI002AB7C4CD|nr:pro-epidermal growth factor-like isoform X1 [Lethenteron reissneri]
MRQRDHPSLQPLMPPLMPLPLRAMRMTALSLACCFLAQVATALEAASSQVWRPPLLVYALGGSVYAVNADGTGQRSLAAPACPSLLLASHPAGERLYWACAGSHAVQAVRVDGTQHQNVVLVNGAIAGLALDWVTNKILWSDRDKGTIEEHDLGSGVRRRLVEKATLPTILALDPINKRLFWVSDSAAAPGIWRSSLEGSSPSRVQRLATRATALAVDPGPRRFFWAEATGGPRAHGFIRSAQYDGRNGKSFRLPTGSQPAGLAVWARDIYFADGATSTIVRLDRRTGGHTVSVVPGPPSLRLGAISLVPQDPRSQATDPELQPFLLFSNGVRMMRINFDGSGFRSIREGLSVGQVAALDYDPVERKVYFVSSATRSIERMDIDGSAKEVLVASNPSLPLGLAVDWLHRKMYWTLPRVFRIEMSNLDGSERRIFFSQAGARPRAIVVHPTVRRVFWTEVGARPRVASAALDGDAVREVARGLLAVPAGLAVDRCSSRLFWSDPRRRVIEVAALDGTARRTLAQTGAEAVDQLAVYRDSVWFTTLARRTVVRLDKRSGRRLVHMQGDSMRPSAIVAVPPVPKSGTVKRFLELSGAQTACGGHVGGSPPAANGSAPSPSTRAATNTTTVSDRGGEASVFPPSPVRTEPGAENNGTENNGTEVGEGRGLVTSGCRACVPDTARRGGSDGWNRTAEPGCRDCGSKPRSHFTDCPEHLRHFCLNGGDCLLVVQLNKPMCKCVAGFGGERCSSFNIESYDAQGAGDRQWLATSLAAVGLALLVAAVAACVLCICRKWRERTGHLALWNIKQLLGKADGKPATTDTTPSPAAAAAAELSLKGAEVICS